MDGRAVVDRSSNRHCVGSGQTFAWDVHDLADINVCELKNNKTYSK